MPKWKEGETEFVVSVNHHEKRGYQCNIPKPVIDELDDPDKIKFVLTKKNIRIFSAD